MLDIDAYLSRIAYHGFTIPTAKTLRAIHRAHLLAVPFENLDIDLHREIPCDENAAIRKIVELKRGGFCYEMNGAFGALLREMGFRVTLLSARVAREDGSEGPEFDHLTLRVDLEEPWLADVGFGESFLDPLRLKVDIEQEQGGRFFRLVEESERIQLQMREPGKAWKNQYSFAPTPRRLEDFASMCRYHQTSPESHFTRKRICTKATEGGRVTLADYKLIVTRNGQREERMLESEEEWRDALNRYFQVVLS
jgi:N-hydroxyarylamine O-acetyltransferase